MFLNKTASAAPTDAVLMSPLITAASTAEFMNMCFKLWYKVFTSDRVGGDSSVSIHFNNWQGTQSHEMRRLDVSQPIGRWHPVRIDIGHPVPFQVCGISHCHHNVHVLGVSRCHHNVHVLGVSHCYHNMHMLSVSRCHYNVHMLSVSRCHYNVHVLSVSRCHHNVDVLGVSCCHHNVHMLCNIV